MTTPDDIREAGGLAYWGGVPRNWPPYDVGDERRDLWLEGWDDARDEVENAKPTETVVNVPRVTFVYEPEYGNPVG